MAHNVKQVIIAKLIFRQVYGVLISFHVACSASSSFFFFKEKIMLEKGKNIFLLLQGLIVYDCYALIDFWPGKALRKDRKTWELSCCGDLLRGIIFRAANSTQNKGPTISF